MRCNFMQFLAVKKGRAERAIAESLQSAGMPRGVEVNAPSPAEQGPQSSGFAQWPRAGLH